LIPGLNGTSLVMKGGDTGRITTLESILSGGPQGGFLNVSGLRFALRISRELLLPVDDQGRPTEGHVELALEGNLRFTSTFDLDLSGFDRLDLSPCMIGSTGIIISAENVKLDLLRTGSIPEVAAAGFDDSFLGIFIGEARIQLPAGFPAVAPEDLVLSNCAIGTGGISGNLTAAYEPVWSDALGQFTGSGAVDLFGMQFGLQEVAIELHQNALVQARFAGSVVLPYFQERVGVELSFDLDGHLNARVTSLGSIVLSNVLRLDLESLGFAMQEGVFVAELSGTVTPLFDVGSIQWPPVTVRRLAVDSRGHVDLDGGWLDLPQHYSIDLYGFGFDLSQIGFGRTDEGDNWFGFSGSIQLVDPLPAGASVDGLRITWGRDAPRISLEGVGVQFEVPEVLRFDGKVSLRETVVDGPQGPERVHRFDGDVALELLALDLRLDATIVAGTAEGASGRYTFGALYLGVELPAGIPLFATGLSLYGLAGLFAFQMEPDRAEDEPWYGLGDGEGWYKRNPIGVTDLKSKWVNRRDSLAFGAGLTIGTTPDNGYMFSGRALMALIFPGPIILIEGKANLLSERSALDEDPMFRAIAVLDGRAGTLMFGLDAAYRIGSSGELIDIRGSAETFFDLSDPSSWYLHVGRDEPRDKRVRARMISLLEANAYLMLDPRGLKTGAWVGYGAQWEFGPFGVVLEAWIDGNVGMSWRPTYFYGDLWLHGRFGVEAFGIGLGLSADAILAAGVFDPLHIRAELQLAVNLPFPFPKLEVDVVLEWGPELDRPELSKPLQEVAIEHQKTSTTWPLRPGEQLLPVFGTIPGPSSGPSAPVSWESIPVVPLDAHPVLTFSHAVHDDALVGDNTQPLEPAWERIGDPDALPPNGVGPALVRYGLTGLVLQRWVNESWVTDAAAGSDPESPLPPNLPHLWGMWDATPRLPEGSGSGIGQYKLRVAANTPFSYTARGGVSSAEWFTDRFANYPCVPAAPERRVCFNADAQTNGALASPFDPGVHPRVELTPAAGELAVVLRPASLHGFERAFRGLGLNLTLTEPARHVALVLSGVTVTEHEECANLDAEPLGLGPNPRIVAGASFMTRDANGDLTSNTSIEMLGPRSGVAVQHSTEVILPCLAHRVTVVILHQADTPVVQAYDVAGHLLQQEQVMAPQALVELNANGIARVRVTAPQQETIIHQLCYTCSHQAPAVPTAVGFGPEGQQFGPVPAIDGVLDVVGTDLVRIELRGATLVDLSEACIDFLADPAEVALREEMSQHLLERAASWNGEDFVLRLHSNYRLKVITALSARGEGSLDDYTVDQSVTEYAYFRTEGPHGLSSFSAPDGQPAFLAEGPGNDGVPVSPHTGLDDLALYIRETRPATRPDADAVLGLARPIYRGYDVGVTFNERYVELMYKLDRRDLGLYLYNRNGQPARDANDRLLVASNRWGEAEEVTLDGEERRWVRVLDESTCIEAPPLESTLPDQTLTFAAPAQVLDPQDLYEARLTPLLVHEAFADTPLGAPAGGGQALGLFEIYDDGPIGGPSVWAVIESGAPPSRSLTQTSSIGGAAVLPEDPVRPGSYAVTGDATWTDFSRKCVHSFDSPERLRRRFPLAIARQLLSILLEPRDQASTAGRGRRRSASVARRGRRHVRSRSRLPRDHRSDRNRDRRLPRR
jgi:hypothetical protein